MFLTSCAVADIPIKSNITLLPNAPNPIGVLRSKGTSHGLTWLAGLGDGRAILILSQLHPLLAASGEPPCCMASSVLFAIKEAVLAARKDASATDPGYLVLNGPATPERVAALCKVTPGQLALTE